MGRTQGEESPQVAPGAGMVKGQRLLPDRTARSPGSPEVKGSTPTTLDQEP